MKWIFFFLVFNIVQSPLFAQEKYEKEIDLSIDEVPHKAMKFFGSTYSALDIDWYYEYNFVGNSVEAKFCHQKKKYSIEFDTLGNLQDIEIEVKPKKIKKVVHNRIDNELTEAYKKHKIIRAQIQYSGDIESFDSFVNQVSTDHDMIRRYELEIKAKKDNQYHLYEITCNKNGVLIKSDRIVTSNTDHFEY